MKMASPILEGERLTMRFGGLVAMAEVSFELAQGEILGIIGPIRADDAEDLPSRQFEADLCHGDKTAEAHGQSFAFQNGRGHLQASY